MGFFNKLRSVFSGKSNKQKEKYVAGLEKSRKNFGDKLKQLAARYRSVNEEYFDELTEILIEADIGVEFTFDVLEETRKESQLKNVTNPHDINEILVDKLFVSYAQTGASVVNEVQFAQSGPTVLLVVGVNGSGKTTSIAKLAKRYIDLGKSVMLVAADTFRAGAMEQLTIWADRLGCAIVTGIENADPASVAYDGMKQGLEQNIDLIIVDTAGRLQNKVNLMNELAKINRVISREIPNAPHETFLVIDGTTGQNGVLQAKAFNESTKLTGVVVTKMDGTSKGGIILSIRDEIGVPVRFIGLGEKMDDLQEFDLDQYLYGLTLGESE